MFSELRKNLYALRKEHISEKLFGEASLAVAACLLHVVKMPEEALFASISEIWDNLPKAVKPAMKPELLDPILQELIYGKQNPEQIKQAVAQNIIVFLEESNASLAEKTFEVASFSLSILYVNGAQKESVINSLSSQFKVLSVREIMENLSPHELFALRRFAPVGHPWFIHGSPEYLDFSNLYSEKVSKMGNDFSILLSKQTGFVPTQDIANLIQRTLTPYKGDFLPDKGTCSDRGDR